MLYKFKEAVDIISGGTPKTSVPEYWNGDIGWLSVVDFGNKNKYVETTEKTITQEGVDNSSTKILEINDIIISARGTVGAMAMLKKPLAFNQSCFGLRGKPEIVNQDFLFYYLKNYMKVLKAKTQGSVFDTINLATFDLIDLNLPTLEEQERIARIFSDIDNKIDSNQAINSELESLAKTIYDYWFLQFEFPNEEGKPYKSSGGKMVWNDELKREIPEGWEVGKIGDITICHDSERIPLSSNERDKIPGDIPYYGATGVMGSVNKAIFNGDYVLLAEDGTVMDEKGNPILQRISGPSWINNHAHILEPINGYSCKLLMMLLKDVYVPMIKTGSIQMKINQENMNNIRIPLIPDVLRKLIIEKLKPIDALQLETNKENQQLSSLRDFLLPMLMNGQVAFKEDK